MNFFNDVNLYGAGVMILCFLRAVVATSLSIWVPSTRHLFTDAHELINVARLVARCLCIHVVVTLVFMFYAIVTHT